MGIFLCLPLGAKYYPQPPASRLLAKAVHHIFQTFMLEPAIQHSSGHLSYTPNNLRGMLWRWKQRLKEISGVLPVTTTKGRVWIHTSRSGWLQSLCSFQLTVLSPEKDKRFSPSTSVIDFFIHSFFFWVRPCASLMLGSLQYPTPVSWN